MRNPGGSSSRSGLAACSTEPDGQGHQDDRRRPGDGVEDDARCRGAEGVREQIRGVAQHVEQHPGRQQEPGRPVPTRQQGEATDHQAQEEDVPDRIGEVRQGRRGAHPGGRDDGLEGERRTQGRGPEGGDPPVDPARQAHVAGFALDEEHDGDVRQGVEAEVEEIGEGRGRRCRTAERLDGEQDVARRPRQQSETEDQRGRPSRAADESPGQAETRGDQLDGADGPSVQPRPGVQCAADEEDREVSDQDRSQHGVGGPQPSRRGVAHQVRGNRVPTSSVGERTRLHHPASTVVAPYLRRRAANSVAERLAEAGRTARRAARAPVRSPAARRPGRGACS